MSKNDQQYLDEVVPVHDPDGMKIWCIYDELLPITNLVKHPKNPNKHPDVQIYLLQKILKEQGWRMPIIVSKRSGYMVAGHGRLEAAIRNGYTRVPVNYQEFDSEEYELLHLVADNRIAELSHMDKGELKDILLEIDTGAVDMDLSGFMNNELENMMTALHQEDEMPDLNEDCAGGQHAKIDKCPHCGKEL
jgi:ParB-like nuclease domain